MWICISFERIIHMYTANTFFTLQFYRYVSTLWKCLCKSTQNCVLFPILKDAEVQPNIEIFGTLMRASGLKFGYKLRVLQVMQKLDIAPNTTFLQHIENSLALARQKIVEAVCMLVSVSLSHVLSVALWLKLL